MTNFERLRWIVEELIQHARNDNKDFYAAAYGKVLDEMNDLSKKYKEEDTSK